MRSHPGEHGRRGILVRPRRAWPRGDLPPSTSESEEAREKDVLWLPGPTSRRVAHPNRFSHDRILYEPRMARMAWLTWLTWGHGELCVLQRSSQAPWATREAGARGVSRGEAMRSRCSGSPWAAGAPDITLTSPFLFHWRLSSGLGSAQPLLPCPSPEINKIYISKGKIPPKHVIISACYSVLWAYSLFLAPCV